MLTTILAALLAAAGGGHGEAGIYGTWANPAGSVIVRTARCGAAVCGRVVWASPKAREDAARKGGVRQLLGLELLRDYRPVGPHQWEGRAFVPDLGDEFDSEMVQTGPNQIEIEGCRFGGLVCKKQVWHRAAAPAAARAPTRRG
jgi:uncharacterized protein (DUF2147 family)